MTHAALSERKDKTVDLACFKELLLQSCGHGFEQEREQALATALHRRMAARKTTRHESYHACLLHDREELLRLTELLTVNETYFFREPGHLNLIAERLPQLLRGREERPIRILSAGCSTGEEPYSIAMILRERFGPEGAGQFAITGVDIDSTVIASAREGIYGESSFRGMDNTLLARYFTPLAAGKLRIAEEIRGQVSFEVVNLLGPDYPPAMLAPDIILYRNVSIYFPGQVQRQIFHKLAELLVEGGCLLVGASETMHHDLGILSLVQEDSLFFYRKDLRQGGKGRGAASGYSPAPERERRPAPRPPASPASKGEARPIPAPAEREACFATALALAREHKPEEALALLDAIIAQEPTRTQAHLLKAKLLLNADRFAEVAALCHLVRELDALCPESYLLLGMVARHQGGDEEALTRFREALYLDHSCWLAHFYAAELHYRLGDEKRAQNGYEATLRLLAKEGVRENGHKLFPLSFNVEPFLVVSRHKLSLLTRKKGLTHGI